MSLPFSSDMGSVCGEQQQHHKFHPSHQLYLHKKSLREIDIPPRKLLSRHTSAVSDMFVDLPKSEETLLQKFLPYNNVNDEDDDEDADPYSSDHFRMYEFKVRKCTRSRSHDWTDCPFAHPGEKARRRDPRKYHYSGTVCPEFRRGSCSRGDSCEFAHGVFECWLHPSRYRTEACKDGKNCKRKVCFFAHTPRQLRILPVNCNENISSPSGIEKKSRNFHHCCAYCHSVSSTSSPTSTLMGMSHFSPPLSPPHSPGMKFSGFSRFSDRFETIDSCGGLSQFNSKLMSYEDAALVELINSLESMNVNSNPSSSPNIIANKRNLPWVDVNFNVDDQPQFVLSPSTPTTRATNRATAASIGRDLLEEYKYNDNALSGPDLGWVNDLLT